MTRRHSTSQYQQLHLFDPEGGLGHDKQIVAHLLAEKHIF